MPSLCPSLFTLCVVSEGFRQIGPRPLRVSGVQGAPELECSVSPPPPKKKTLPRFTPYLYSACPCVNSAQAVVILRPGLFVLGCQHRPMRNCSSRRTGGADLCGNPCLHRGNEELPGG